MQDTEHITETGFLPVLLLSADRPLGSLELGRAHHPLLALPIPVDPHT